MVVGVVAQCDVIHLTLTEAALRARDRRLDRDRQRSRFNFGRDVDRASGRAA